jgi:hypothetical protein
MGAGARGAGDAGGEGGAVGRRRGLPGAGGGGQLSPAIPEVQNGAKFRAEGLQIAAGVPLQVGEGPEFRTFRLGLFGLDKLKDVDATVARLKRAVDAVL